MVSTASCRAVSAASLLTCSCIILRSFLCVLTELLVDLVLHWQAMAVPTKAPRDMLARLTSIARHNVLRTDDSTVIFNLKANNVKHSKAAAACATAAAVTAP